MKRFTTSIFVTWLVVLFAASVQAQPVPNPRLIFWQGGTGTLTDANYNDGTNANLTIQPTVPAATADHVYIGNNGVLTFTGGVGFGRLRVGHNQSPPGGQGAATLTLTGAGTLVELNDGSSAPDAALWVGSGNNGTLNIENGAELRLNRLAVVGAGNNTTATGTLNVKSGGILTVSDGNLNIADRSGTTGNGVKGVVNISDAGSAISILGPGADLLLANRARTATYNQTDGTVNVNDTIDVAGQAGSSTGTTFSVSGGTITSGTSNGLNAGNFFLGRGASVGATVNISGTAVVNVGNRYLMGGTDSPGGTPPPPPTAISTGVVTNHSAGTLNTDRDMRVADAFISPTSDATYNLSGTGIINTNTLAFTVAADSTTIIGRQGTGKFIQTGGTANFNSPLIIGDRNGATTTTANGLYKISAGDLNINAPTPTWPLALSIAANGTGELRVVGDDATIDLTGDLLVNSTANGNGKLAYEFESGDLLSTVNVTGVATFSAGSILALDTTNTSPTQTSYDLLTATSIVTTGLTFSGPLNWNFEVVTTGSGQILRAIQTGPPVLTGDYNQNGKVDGADYVVWRKTNINGAQGYTDWRANFGAGSPGAGLGSSHAVPEPSTALLMIATVALGSGLNWRRVR